MTIRQMAAAALAAVFAISGIGAILISQQTPRPVDAVELRGDDPAIRRDDDDPARLEVDAGDDDRTDDPSGPSDDVAGDTTGPGGETATVSASVSVSNGTTSVSADAPAAPAAPAAPPPPPANDVSVSRDDSVSVDSASSASDD